MRGALMRLWTKEEHCGILAEKSDVEAAGQYNSWNRGRVTPRNVRYWRKVFIENNGNLAKTDREMKNRRNTVKPQPDDDVGDVSFIPKCAERILVIPDLHAPYQHPDTLRFLRAVKDQMQPDLVVSLGDELDYHAMSFHDSDPNLDSAGAELERGKKFLKKLHAEFPQVLVCHSNHGSMTYRRAKAHGIPVQLVRRYRDIVFPGLDASGWSWADSWKVITPLGSVMFKHQSSGILADAVHNGCNLVVGHSHGNFSVEYCASSAHLYYGCYSGCLVDKDSLAFAYGRLSKNKPIIGCTLILNGRPTLIPMVLKENGRWQGKL